VAPMTSTLGFTPGQPPEWDLERFMRGDEVDTAVITFEGNRRTFAWKCADVPPKLPTSAPELGELLGACLALLEAGSSSGRTQGEVHRMVAEHGRAFGVRKDRLDPATACA
jgi:hypothetical protein